MSRHPILNRPFDWAEHILNLDLLKSAYTEQNWIEFGENISIRINTNGMCFNKI